jgi:hypothetical protein
MSNLQVLKPMIMKSPLLLMSCLVFSILIIGCGSEQKENHLTERNIKGDVKSVINKEYDAIERFGEIEKESINSWYDIAFNEEGNPVEEISYDSDGSISLKYTYEYDEEGNQVEYVSYNSEGSISYINTREFIYDHEGNWKRTVRYSKGSFGKQEAQWLQESEYEYYD